MTEKTLHEQWIKQADTMTEYWITKMTPMKTARLEIAFALQEAYAEGYTEGYREGEASGLSRERNKDHDMGQ